jgi:hypothetical protein
LNARATDDLEGPAFPVEKNRAIIIWKKKPEAIQDLFKGLTDE